MRIMGKLRILVIIILIGVIIYCGYQIGIQYYNYYVAKNYYDSIDKEYAADNQNSKAVKQDSELAKLKFVDFAKLQARYPDVVGWLTVPDTQVNYPVVKSKEDYYLRRDLDKNYLYSGTLFMFDTQSLSPMDQNIIIYGHHMRNGSMFGELKNIVENVSKYKNFYFFTKNKIYKYEICAAYNTNSLSVYTHYDLSDKEIFKSFTGIMRNGNIKSPLKQSDKFITLSTCTYVPGYENGRMVVQGVLKKTIKI